MRLKLAAYIASDAETSKDWRKKYDYVGYFREGLATVKLNGKWGSINKKGEIVIPLKYDQIGDFHEGLAIVELNGKWGFINTEGQEVISIKYDFVGSFFEGLVQVKFNGKYGFVNTKGVEVVQPKYTQENVEDIPTVVRLLALRRNISKEEALKLVLEEMAK